MEEAEATAPEVDEAIMEPDEEAPIHEVEEPASATSDTFGGGIARTTHGWCSSRCSWWYR